MDLNRLEKEETNFMEKIKEILGTIKTVYKTTLSVRGSGDTTMYFKVPKELRKHLQPQLCNCKLVRKGKKRLFVFEVK